MIDPPRDAAEVAPPRRNRRAAQLSTLLGVLIGGVAIAFVVHTLIHEWDRVRDALAEASWGWMALGLVLAAAAMTAIAWGWGTVLALLGPPANRVRVVAWYYVGELGKYLPGGVWPVVGRGELATRGGIPRSRAYASVALSLVMLYLAAMIVGIAALPFALVSGGHLALPMALLLLLPLGLLFLHPRVLEPLLAKARRVTKRELAADVPMWRDSVGAVLAYVPSWLFVGFATWAVARALVPDPPIARILFATTLSWVAGFLAVPVPAGAGVREAVFIAASGLDPGLGATVAISTRVLFILVDGGGAALAVPFLRHRGEDLDAHEGDEGDDGARGDDADDADGHGRAGHGAGPEPEAPAVTVAGAAPQAGPPSGDTEGRSSAPADLGER